MKIGPVRKQALSLPEVTEEPHFHFASFRVCGKILITVPPEETHIVLFIGEEDRERALTLYPEFSAKRMWGARVSGLRMARAVARTVVVTATVGQAGQHKGPKRLWAGADWRLRT